MPPWEKYAAQSPAKAGPWSKYARRSPLQEVAGAAATFNEMIPFADEVGAAIGVGVDAASGKVRSLDDLKDSWSRQRATQDEFTDDFEERRPGAAALTRGTALGLQGAVPIGPSLNALATGNRALAAARGATLAGTQAGVQALADRGTLDERLGAGANALSDPLTLGLGAALGAAAVPGRARQSRLTGKNALSSEDLGKMKAEAYRKVDQSDFRFSPEEFQDMSRNALARAEEDMIDPVLHSDAARVLSILQRRADEGFAPSLKQVDQLRQIARDDAVAKGGGNALHGGNIVDALDDLIDSSGGGNALRDARSLNTRYRRTQAVEDAIGRAEDRTSVSGSGGNIDNATRARLLAARDKMKGLSEQEQAAFEKVVRGTPLQNATRLVGKMAPTGNGLMTMLNSGFVGSGGAMGAMSGGGAGGAALGAAVGAVPGVAGVAAKSVSEAIGRRNIQELLEAVSTGGGTNAELQALQEALASAPATQELNALRRALSERLSRVSGAANGANQDPTIRQTADGWEVDVNRGYGGTGR